MTVMENTGQWGSSGLTCGSEEGGVVASADYDIQPWIKLLGWLLAVPLFLAAQVWVFWTMWVYLVGGTVPLLGWETGTNLVMVLVTMVIGEPIAVGLARVATMIVILPLALVFSQKRPLETNQV